MEPFIIWLERVLVCYALAGLAFAIPFVSRGAGRIDPVAGEGTWGFRLIILPGVIALWPLLAARWWSGARHPPAECNAHRRAARRVPS